MKGFSDLEEYAGRCFPAPHRLGTYLGAFTSFHREALPKVAMDDSQHLAFFKSHLESNIRRGWKKALKTADRTLNEIGCLEEIPPPKISPEDGHYLFDLPTPKCGQQKNCGLKAYMALNRDQFERIREHLSKLEPSDAETKKRIKALRALYRNPNQNFKRTECYQCGDALIAHEGRNDGIILTRNGKHFEPICDLLETQVLSY
ncbi:MAG: hypothetical protein P1U58_13865 [Verrucomicrobiales bacterium]|nr:hypothetical protein [Verrucomicrobiales bacterium]